MADTGRCLTRQIVCMSRRHFDHTSARTSSGEVHGAALESRKNCRRGIGCFLNKSPLSIGTERPNVVLAPHLGSASNEPVARWTGRRAKYCRVFQGQRPPNYAEPRSDQDQMTLAGRRLNGWKTNPPRQIFLERGKRGSLQIPFR